MMPTLQGPLLGYFGRCGEVVVTGTCESCGQEQPLAAFTAREWIRVGPFPFLPLQRWRVFDVCPLCGHALRMPYQDYRSWCDDATAADRAALLADPESIERRLALAWSYYGLGCHHEALATLVPAVCNGAPPEVRHAAGVAWRALGQLDEAIAELTAAAEQAPGEPLYHLDLGRALLRRRDRLALAEGHLSEACKLAPNDPEAWVALARVRVRRKVWDEARRAWSRALAVDPRLADRPECQDIVHELARHS